MDNWPERVQGVRKVEPMQKSSFAGVKKAF